MTAVPIPAEPHCASCTCGKRAPVQREFASEKRGPARAAGTITWAEHLEVYAAYAARFGRAQSAETLAARGGFGYYEIVEFTGHEPRTWVPR